ncbi:hypothetical protein [Singulisphaera acidiphila]|uniref:Uncharacterized protein n=1 Tax=Singulisphaera acidiphila (strain ATCC BAA-1392 / DSM 18658 / VKM B-2454 / MOB10) TaxID=886293 RepID=L0DRN2_SINAD|nr:hypothetical protein [Singulisphaera acidiphila]AGA31655.1 hypothetical protein Sinac_7624 [Singulisphaera acidiphila DSM 18658]
MGRATATEMQPIDVTSTATPVRKPREFTTAEVNAIIRLAEAGDRTALPDIRAILSGPRRKYFMEAVGNPGWALRSHIIQSLSGPNLLGQEVMKATISDLEQELTPPDATPLERLLVERAVACWLAIHDAEKVEMDGRGKDISAQMRELQQRRIDRAHNRFLSALKALGTAQRLKGGSTTVSMSRTDKLTVKSE